jgi:hypothetical protein
MRRLVPFVAAAVFASACRSGQAMPTASPPDLTAHRLVGCDEKSRGPQSAKLKVYVGQRPLVYVTSMPSCEDFQACRAGYELAVFEDGLLVYEGPACGAPAPQVVVRHLDRPTLASLRRRLEACDSLSSSKYSCSHGDRLWVECRTESRYANLLDDCDSPGNSLRAFNTSIAQTLNLERLVRDRESCATSQAPVVAGDLRLTIHPLHSRNCTYAPK